MPHISTVLDVLIVMVLVIAMAITGVKLDALNAKRARLERELLSEIEYHQSLLDEAERRSL